MRHLILVATATAFLATTATAQVVIKDSGPNAGPIVGVISDPVREYVVRNPRQPVILEGEIREGFIVPETVELVPVPDSPDFVYFYADDNRPVVVRKSDRSVVYVQSSETVKTVETVEESPEEVITYVRKNPVDPLVLEGEVGVGYEVPAEANLQPVEGFKGYSYFYYNGRPYVVDSGARKVVRILD